MHLRDFGGSAYSHVVSDAEICAYRANVSVPDMFWIMTHGDESNRPGCRFTQESNNGDLSSDNDPRVTGHHGGR